MLVTVLLESINLISSIYIVHSKVFSQAVNLSNGPIAPNPGYTLYNYVNFTRSKPMGQWVIQVNTYDPVATLVVMCHKKFVIIYLSMYNHIVV